jgi:hypothetical protein
MSTKNKKNIASQALLEMDAITSAIKEESKNTLNILLSEAVRNALRESCEEEKEYDVVDDEQEDNVDDNENNSDGSAKSEVEEDENNEIDAVVDNAETEAPMGPEETAAIDNQEAPMDGEGEESLDDFSEYQTTDDENTYDLTGEKDYEKVVKVFKLLKGDDNIVVRKDDNTIQLKDNEAGTEYVIDLGADDNDTSVDSVDSEEIATPDMGLNESDIAGFEDEGMSDDLNLDNEFTDETKVGEASELESLKSQLLALQQKVDSMNGNSIDGGDNNLYENKSRKSMKGSKETLFEVDLGYTDNYQDTDPIAGLSNNEPSKSGKSWHKGVPTGTQKPWAGETKSKGEPFEKTVNEEDEMTPDMGVETPVEEGTNIGGAVQQRSSSKTNMPKGRKEYGPKVKRHVSAAGEYDEVVNENKKLKQENKALKEAIIAIRKNLSEAYVTNANLGKITKLFLENTTSQAEKVDIVNRFSNEAKTIEQSKSLYESIKRELNKTNPSLNINESVTANGTAVINENKVYKSDDLLKTIDLMKRITNF